MNVIPNRPEAGAEPMSGYTLEHLLGRGGFGEVWRARAPGGFRVALKFLAAEGEEAARELQAVRMLVNLRDSHLISLHGVWDLPGYHVLAMELADCTLMDRLKDCLAQGLTGVPRDELLRYFLQAAAGIDFLNEPRHDLGGDDRVSIQHGDIKPQNLLIVGSGVKVGDFGLLRQLHSHLGSFKTGSLTVLYAAPELFSGRLARQTDQYSLAITWCHLRGGPAPFHGGMAEVMSGHVFKEPDLSMLPEEEQAAVRRALSKSPQDRWPTCMAFVEALGASTLSSPASPRSAAVPAPAIEQAMVRTISSRDDVTARPTAPPALPSTQAWREKPKRSRAGVVLALAAAALLVAVTTMALLKPATPDQPSTPDSSSPKSIAKGAATPVVAPAKPQGKSAPLVFSKSHWLARLKPLSSNETAFIARASARPDVSPEPVLKRRSRVNSIGMRLVFLEPGSFQMGSPKGEKGRVEGYVQDGVKVPYAFETRHRVKLTEGYFLGAYLVTQEQWTQVMKSNPSKFTEGDRSKLPVDNVSWEDCQKFCEELSRKEGRRYTLPTEAQWEYACRAGKETAYSFGDDAGMLKQNAWFEDNADARPHAVGEKEPNRWGLYDMHGNLFQWCEDTVAPFTEEEVTDPPASEGGDLRILRGGSWATTAEQCRAAFRLPAIPKMPNPRFGLRVVCRTGDAEATARSSTPPAEYQPILKP